MRVDIWWSMVVAGGLLTRETVSCHFFFWRVGVIFFVFSIEREKVPFFICLLLVIFRKECLMKI
jgi:hypothetical protein